MEAAPVKPKEPVELAAQPASRLWIAALMALGAAALASASVLVLGEIFLALRRVLLEAMVLARNL